jgi:hypothetical protein
VVLVRELEPGVAQKLVDLELLAFRHCLRVVAVEGADVREQTFVAGKAAVAT